MMGNPTGKGGFGDHPENINRSGRSKKSDAVRRAFEDFFDDETKDGKAHLKRLTKETFKKICDGDNSIIMFTWEQLMGKAKQRAEVEQHTNLTNPIYDLLSEIVENESQSKTD